MNRGIWFRICEEKMSISVHTCDLPGLREISITIFPWDERPIKEYNFTFTPEKYAHIMDLVIHFKGVID